MELLEVSLILYSLIVNLRTTSLNIQKLYVVPTERISVLVWVSTTKGSCFLVQRQLIWFYN